MTFQEIYEQPKFYVAADCVIFGYENEELKLLLYPRKFEPSYKQWSLMGEFVLEKESVSSAARRILKQTLRNVDLTIIALKKI